MITQLIPLNFQLITHDTTTNNTKFPSDTTTDNTNFPNDNITDNTTHITNFPFDTTLILSDAREITVDTKG
jgi:hypothetical protein